MAFFKDSDKVIESGLCVLLIVVNPLSLDASLSVVELPHDRI